MNKERDRQIKKSEVDRRIDRQREREDCLLLEYCELTLYLFMFQLSVLSKIAIQQKHNHLYQIIYNNITIILKIMKNVYCILDFFLNRVKIYLN